MKVTIPEPYEFDDSTWTDEDDAAYGAACEQSEGETRIIDGHEYVLVEDEAAGAPACATDAH